MKNQNSKFYSILSWLLPSASETAFFGAMSIMTLMISNASSFRDLIFLPEHFQLKSAVLDSLNNFLVGVVGDNIARSAVVAVFWALVGLAVYILIWLLLNFSNELGNDLAAAKYMHPRNVDTKTPLRDFLSRTSFQLVTLVVFIFYLNIVISVLLPYYGGLFRTAIQQWPSYSTIRFAIIGIVSEILVLHFCVILLRALVLRKRIFG